MGEGFNFTSWCDTWLKSSGLNILEPVVEYNEDWSVKEFSIRQLNDLRGKNRLRTHKLSVGFYDPDMNLHETKGIMVSDKDGLTSVQDFFKGPVRAIIINHDDHAYAKIRFDQQTLRNLGDSLHLIKDPQTRSQVWRQLWLHVLDRKLSSVEYFNLVMQALPHEPVEQTLTFILQNLNALMLYYMPLTLVEESQTQLFGMLLSLLQTAEMDSLKSTVLDNMLQFAVDKEHLDLTLVWCKIGHAHPPSSPETRLARLTYGHLTMTIKMVYRSPFFTEQAKKNIFVQILGTSKTSS